MIDNKIYCDDSLNILKKMKGSTVDLFYMDPPFYTQEIQKLTSGQKNVEYSFLDKWESMDDYLEYMKQRFAEAKRVLKSTGSIFVHCDRNASHYLKVLLDQIFGMKYFQSEIIWTYKRWSNSKKGLLNNHQVILFYSKTDDFKFNKIYTAYSETTNVDQILQDRVRDENGKTKYKCDHNGDIILGNSKKGVPLSDVWEIPYLNPKAKERVGYPTQKPIILLEQIINLVTDEDDLVMDPFMGSGTTLVAAKLLGRKYIGVDLAKEAVELTKERLETLVKTESFLLQKGKAAYRNLTERQMAILNSIGATPVQRNSGIDGFMNEYVDGKPVSIKIQKLEETLDEAIEKLMKASRIKKCKYMVLIRTHIDVLNLFDFSKIPNGLMIIDSFDIQISEFLNREVSQIQVM